MCVDSDTNQNYTLSLTQPTLFSSSLISPPLRGFSFEMAEPLSLFTLIDLQDAADIYDDSSDEDSPICSPGTSRIASEMLDVVKSTNVCTSSPGPYSDVDANHDQHHGPHISVAADLVQDAIRQERHDPSTYARRCQKSGFGVLLRK